MAHVADLLRREGFPITFAPPVTPVPGAPVTRPVPVGGARFVLGAAAGAVAVAGAVTGGTLSGGVDLVGGPGVTGYVPDSGAVIDTAGPRLAGAESAGSAGTADGSVDHDRGRADAAPREPRKVVLVPADVAAANSLGAQLSTAAAPHAQQRPAAQRPVQQGPRQGGQPPSAGRPAPAQQRGDAGLLGGIVGGVGDVVGGVVDGVTDPTETTAGTQDDGLQPALSMISGVGGLFGG